MEPLLDLSQDLKKEIEVVPFKGKRYIAGFNGLVNGYLDDKETKEKAMENLKNFYRE